MRDPIEYQHFANLVERVAVVTERLENVCKILERHTIDVQELDERVRALERQQDNHAGRMSGGWMVACVFAGAMAYGITNFIYYKMIGLK